MKKEALKWTLLYLLGLWGIASIIVCAGEDLPGLQMSDGLFFGTKLAGITSLLLCFRAGRWLNKKGLLPEIEEG